MYENIVQLKMTSKKDVKNYLTDTLDTKGILRLIESVPSSKAEPFKLWLAKMDGHAANVARDDIEKNLGKTIISNKNSLSYRYINQKQLSKNSNKKD